MATLFEIPNITNGPDDLIVGLATEIPIFSVMVLLFVFTTVFLGGMATQGRRSGYVDAPLWATLSFLTIDLIALIMSLTPGIINPVVLAVCFGGTFFSALWLFLSKGRFEN